MFSNAKRKQGALSIGGGGGGGSGGGGLDGDNNGLGDSGLDEVMTTKDNAINSYTEYDKELDHQHSDDYDSDFERHRTFSPKQKKTKIVQAKKKKNKRENNHPSLLSVLHHHHHNQSAIRIGVIQETYHLTTMT
jgi:hypothetical protein